MFCLSSTNRYTRTLTSCWFVYQLLTKVMKTPADASRSRSNLLVTRTTTSQSEQPYLTPINYPTMAEHTKSTHLEILAIATFYNVPVYYCQLLRGQYSGTASGRVSEFQKRFSHHHISSYHTRSTYITTALSRSLVKSARTYLPLALKKSMCQMFCNDDTVFVYRLRNPSFLVYLFVTCCARARPWGKPSIPVSFRKSPLNDTQSHDPEVS